MPNHSENHSIAMLNYRKRMEKKAMTFEINNEERAKRSPQAQIALLDQRLGKGVGASKERARLTAQIEAADAPADSAPVKEKKAKKK